MPRVKSIPVRRYVHRFESDSLPDYEYDGNGDLMEDEEKLPEEPGGEMHPVPSPSEVHRHESPSNSPLDEPNEWLSLQNSLLLQETPFVYCCKHQVGDENFFFLSSVAVPLRIENLDENGECILELGMSILTVRMEGAMRSHRYPDDALRFLTHALSSGTIIVTYQCRKFEAESNLILQYYSVAMLSDCPPSFFSILDCEAVFSTEKESLNFDANRLLCDVEAMQRVDVASDESHSNLAELLHKLGILTKLRPYQLDGVEWMLRRLETDFQFVNTMSYLHIIPPSSTIGFHFSPFYGCLLHSPALSYLNSSLNGFILADEMGLGKSLQILSLVILTRERQDSLQFQQKQQISDFVATISLKQQLSRRTAARKLSSEQLCLCGRGDLKVSDLDWITFLIIMPSTLLNQWQTEVRKHIDTKAGLKVFVWDEDAFSKKDRILEDYSPEKLSSYDIIMLSFSALRLAYHSSKVSWDECGVKQLKNGIIPPPFLCLQFRMIVVDETQNLEGSSESHALQISCKLHTRCRICVSGTPIGHNSLSDLSSLMQFLRIHPFVATRKAWTTILTNPRPSIAASVRLQWITDMFKQIMLRRTKESVLSQLGLPPRVSTTRYLVFSQFEQALYDEKLSSIQQQLGEEGRSAGPDVGSLRYKLEVLRKGCCHPQLLDVRLRGQQTANSVSKPLDHIMVNKVEQARLRCEEIQRDVILYLHKIAGLVWLKAECSVQQSGNYLDGIDTRYLLLVYAIYTFTWIYVTGNSASSHSLGLMKFSGRDKSQQDYISALIGSFSLALCASNIIARASAEDNIEAEEPLASSLPWHTFSSLSLSALKDFVRSATGDFKPEALNEVLLSSALACQIQFSHTKCLTSVNATLDINKLIAFLECEIEANSTCLVLLPSNLVLRPQLINAIGEDFISCRVDNTLFDLSAHIYSSPTTSESIRLQLPRCKTWHVSVNMAWGCALLFNKDIDGIIRGCIHDFRRCPISGKGVEVKCFVTMDLCETAFNADDLQKLHLSYNLLNTYESLAGHLGKSDGLLPTLNAVESIARNARISDIGSFMNKIDNILNDLNLSEGNRVMTEGNSAIKRMLGVTSVDLTPRKRSRVDVYDEGDVTPS
eukprot:gene31877-38542_t